MSLRPKLRAQAAGDLDDLVSLLHIRAAELVEGIESMWGTDLLKLAAGGRTETIKDKLITRLTDHKEFELEKFFDQQQQALPLESQDKGESK